LLNLHLGHLVAEMNYSITTNDVQVPSVVVVVVAALNVEVIPMSINGCRMVIIVTCVVVNDAVALIAGTVCLVSIRLVTTRLVTTRLVTRPVISVRKIGASVPVVDISKVDVNATAIKMKSLGLGVLSTHSGKTDSSDDCDSQCDFTHVKSPLGRDVGGNYVWNRTIE